MLRLCLLLVGSLTAAYALPQGNFLGTKADSAQAISTTAGSGMNFVQMIVAVGIVLAIMKWALPSLLKRFGGRLSTKFDSQIKLEEAATFAGGTLQVITVRNRTLLLGVTGSSISTLADLGVTPSHDPGPTFSEFLEQSDHAISANEGLARFAVIQAPTPTFDHPPTEPKSDAPAPDWDQEAAMHRIDRLLRR